MLQFVQAIYKISPKVVSLEDKDGATALGYAITAETDRRVVRLLRMPSTKDWNIGCINQKGSVRYALRMQSEIGLHP